MNKPQSVFQQIEINEQETVTFEKMAAIDLEEVMSIERKVFSSPWTKKMFYAEFFDNPLSSSFVARLGGQIIGYLFFWEVAGEFHLMNIAVAPQWQRKGIGEAWMKWVLEMGRKGGIRGITLEVRASNLPARLLYRKFGFYEVGIRKQYYRSPLEDAILLTYDFH